MGTVYPFTFVALTAMVASLDVSPTGFVYTLQPNGLHKIDPFTAKVTDYELENYGYHEIAVSSKYIILSQEFYR